ncbi:MAG: MFS transporter [Tenericutes bacterium]|nr:MFS transporter [Mycoplasmatota bacterium]
MKKLFKNRNYFLLFQGSLVSAIGTSLYSFAAGLYVQDLFGEDGGAIYLSLFMAVSIIIQIVLSPITGTIVDKVNKIKVLYVTDFIRALLFATTLYVLTLGYPKEIIIWVLLGTTAIASVNQAFFGPAATASIPEIVGEDQIQAANGANSIVSSVQGILGIVAGMFLYAIVGFEAAVLINAISFMFSAITEMFIKTDPKLVNEQILPEDKPSFWEDIKFGFKYLKSTTGLLTMMIFSAMLNFCFSPVFGVGIPYLFRTELGSSEYELGIIDIVFSITMLIASIIVGSMKIKSLKKSVKKGIISMAGVFVLMTIFIVLVTYNIIGYWLFFALMIAINSMLAFTMIYTNVPINTGMMKAIDPKVRGRVFATIGAMSMAAIPISTLAAGFIVNATNVAVLSIIFSFILVIVTFGVVSNKNVAIMLDGIDNKGKELAEAARLKEDPASIFEAYEND